METQIQWQQDAVNFFQIIAYLLQSVCCHQTRECDNIGNATHALANETCIGVFVISDLTIHPLCCGRI